MSSYSEVSVVKRFEVTIIICPIAKNEPWLYQILSHFYINQFETVCHTRITFGSYWKAAMTDDVGDGICCQSGEDPYELYMDDEVMIYGSDFNYGKKVSHDIIVGYQTTYYPVENICRRWFEREETWPYPDNAHFTQGLWRSARYVGCAESEKTMANGGTCRIQVCRYARAGICNMGKYQSATGDNWKEPMLMDDNPCGPVCPPNGCH